jgi:hypothetical protein
MTIDRTEAGAQVVLPGAEKATNATMAQRRADEPLRAKVAQKPVGGLFGDGHRQIELF